MALPHPQAPQDWLTQAWNIALGRRMDASLDRWLMGPIGDTDGIHEKVIAEIACREGLSIDRANRSAGLMGDFSGFPHVVDRVDPRIAEFYTATSAFDFECGAGGRGALNLGVAWLRGSTAGASGS